MTLVAAYVFRLKSFAQQRVAYQASTSEDDSAKDRLLPKVDLSSFPHVLDLVLDGLERMRSA